jgi:ABC-type sugar transport system substrate-binding protein
MRKTTKLVSVMLAFLLIVACVSACGNKSGEASATTAPAATAAAATAAPSATGKTIVIAKVPITLSHNVHGNDSKWAKIYAQEKYGAEYEVIDPEQDQAKEVAACETFIAEGVDGIILHPITETCCNEVITEIRDAGIACITYNVDDSSHQVPFLAIDEASVAKQMGTDMCKQWVELYPDIPIAIGLLSWTNITFCFDNRTGPFLEGARSVVDYLPKDIVYQNSKGEDCWGATYWEHAGGDYEKAVSLTADAIVKHPEVNIVYGDNEQNGTGALAAYEAAGRGLAKDGVPQTEIIASTDGSAGELTKIADPTSSLKYCLGMQPQTFAYAEVDMIMQVINGELDPDTYTVQYTPDVYINYYKMSLQEIQDWYNTQYMPDTKLDLVGQFGA